MPAPFLQNMKRALRTLWLLRTAGGEREDGGRRAGASLSLSGPSAGAASLRDQLERPDPAAQGSQSSGPPRLAVGALVTSEEGATLEGGCGRRRPRPGAVMELVPQARELGCWAAGEMRVPAASRAPESTFRR